MDPSKFRGDERPTWYPVRRRGKPVSGVCAGGLRPGTVVIDEYTGEPAMKRPSRPAERPIPAEFRLIGADGVNLGIVTRDAARALADEEGLDLVAVAPDATPAVYRVANASKLKYEADMKAREARRGSQKSSLKELKYRPNIDDHDFATKTNWVRKFIAQGHPVKITVMLRGREQGRPEVADRIFTRLSAELVDVAQIRGQISRLGRDVIGTFEPKQTK